MSAVDGKGMATVGCTSDGKDHQVKAGEGWKVGAKVECETKNNAMECRPAAAQSSAAQPRHPPDRGGETGSRARYACSGAEHCCSGS